MTTTASTQPPPASARPAVIWALSAAAAGAAAIVLRSTRSLPAPLHPLGIPWWALAIGFALAECAVVHVHLRRETHTLSPSAVPLVLGLLAVSPLGLVAARLARTAAALGLYRRQRPRRIVFDLATSALGTALAVAVFRALDVGRYPLRPTGWMAALTAASLAAATGLAIAAAAASLAGGRRALGRLPTTAAVTFAWTLTMASLALAAATLVATRPSAIVLLLLPTAACALALRAYGLHRRRDDPVQPLYDLRPRREDDSELDAGIGQLLRAARRLLTAEYAELLILPADPRERPLRSSVDTHDEVLLEPSDLSAAERDVLDMLEAGGGVVTTAREQRVAGFDPYLAERGLKDGILTTLVGESGLLGLLLVGNRADHVATFGRGDEKRFRTFAGHAALLLEKEQLGQSLARLTEVEAEFRHQALHDALTGLPNRRLFHARVDQASRRAAADGLHPIVLFIDLDGFKAINDDLGHAAGDELLAAFAERLRGNVRPDELPARLGGDEFAVLIESGGPAVAEDVARRLLAAVRDPFSIRGRRLSVRLSIGIAAARSASGVEPLLANADLAMYAAKAERRSSYAVYTDAMRGSAEERRELAAALEEALNRDQIAVHYQPIVDLRTGATVAFEALARWRRGTSDTVAAAEFLHAADGGELMERIGRVVLRAACLQTQEWRAESDPARDLSVSVNLSPLELGSPRLAVDVAAALLESGLDAGRLVLEIAEEVATADVERALATMSELRRLGVRFALDGLGSGRSSLDQICRLPFDVIKIARPLVEQVGTGHVEERLPRAIVGVARSLGVKVVAEGIESREQVERVRQLGCHLGQGFYFDGALAAAQATRRLRTPSPAPVRVLALDSA